MDDCRRAEAFAWSIAICVELVTERSDYCEVLNDKEAGESALRFDDSHSSASPH